MSWWQEIFDDVGDAFGKFGDFVSDGLSTAFNNFAQPNQGSQPSSSGGSNENYSNEGRSFAQRPVESGESASGGIIGKVMDFANKNKGLTEIVLKGISGGIASENQAEQRMKEMRAKDQMDQEASARVSASVSGLRGPGIINRQAQLKRTDGSGIYTNGKIYKG
ncbi:hypothetical protein [Rhodoferax mekongensis]|uniref:Uncharacterized protein n=1 Tax=Rhodoferax mekongensis TaxID=3068341 RepID=A0ABZ0B3X2_9BURK|nr:hypothetical protein [Rhodoferax sp. TBRC 17307]WNO06061.1 hypothetical protein RAN89_06420 [Rhodoferax sp. TBRC 17307]